MKATKGMVAVFAVAALMVSATPASAGAAAYKKYVGCGISRNATPSHVCPKRSKKGAFFKSFNGDVTYTVCVRFPSHKNLCARGQKAEKNTLYVNKITSTEPGRHQVSWFVKGKRVGRFVFRVKS